MNTYWWIRILTFSFALEITAWGQETAALSGQIVDQSQSGIALADVALTHLTRGGQRSTTTTGLGYYTFATLEPGEYSVVVRKSGFADLQIGLLRLRPRDRQTLVLEMKIAATADSITVEARAEGTSSDASNGAVIEQDFLRHLPVNGRTVSALVRMAPGVTSSGGPGGGLHVNGLRSNTNYYMLDGVSVAQGQSIGGGPGGPGGGGPGLGGGGGSGTDSISLDTLEEVRVQTSAFAPEFGRTPGAQVSMVSRGGSNDWHGSAYEYFRNGELNANDWFANRAGLARGAMRQNQFGGTLGGPVIRNRTFFFAGVEMLRLLSPDTSVSSVPDRETRRSARGNLRPFLNAFPIANGPALDNGAAQYSAVFSNPQSRDSASLRVDHTLGARHTLFGRYSWAPSDGVSRGSDFISSNTLMNRSSKSHSGTGSLLSNLKPGVVNDLRVNLSHNGSSSYGTVDTLGGAVPLTDAQMFPRGVDTTTGTFSLNILGLSSYTYGQRMRNEQTQLNVVDGLTMIADRHTYKIGVDVRSLWTANHNVPYSVNAVFSGLSGENQSFLSGSPASAVVSASQHDVYPSTFNFSFYFQDTYRASARTVFTLGVRWDVNPAPTTWRGDKPLAISSLKDTRVTQEDSLYNLRLGDVAPRFGVSHQIRGERGRELTFRGGLGVFNDLGYGTSLSAFSGAPYVNSRTLTAGVFPLATSDLAAPVLPPVKPYNQVGAAERTLQSPRVWQWNGTLEKAFSLGEVLSVGYAGTRGRRLLRTTTTPSFSTDYDLLRLATNGAESDYNSLQAQYRRRMGKRLQTQVSYTCWHSVDTASNDAGFGGGFATLFTSEKGNSDFDIRHNLNVTGTYFLGLRQTGILGAVLGGWYTDFQYAARTGTPFDVVGLTADSSNASATNAGQRGLFAQVRPNYNGKPIWIADAGAPGGKKLNRDAFEAPSGYGQGNLGRNVIRGFGLMQLDLTVRREIRVGERYSFHVSAQAFNAFNQQNFSNPSRNEGANLTSANFGVANRTQTGGIGGGGSAFRSGGPRSLQLSVRMQF